MSTTKKTTSTSTSSSTHSSTQADSTSTGTSSTKKVLDEELLAGIMGGLYSQMSDSELEEYAGSLLRPALDAELEGSRQQEETAELTRTQEIAALQRELETAVSEQKKTYASSSAALQNAALARGMGRSSYLLSQLAGQGEELAETVRQLTDESGKKQSDLQEQISLAKQQGAETRARLNADYETNLAAKLSELRQDRQSSWNSSYLTAVSAALGSLTNSQSRTTSTSTTNGESSEKTNSSSSTTTQGSGTAKKTTGGVDAVSSAAAKA